MHEKKTINTFIFDCFGVIYNPFLMGWYTDYSKKHNFVDENLHETLNQFDLGILSEEDIVDYFSKYKGVNLSKEKLQDEIDSYLKLDHTLIRLIKQLKEKGFKTALLSNANHSFFERKIYPTYPEFKNLFDEIVISSQVGMLKPNDDIFLYTLQKVRAEPEEVLFIDDSESNVLAAIKLGMDGYIYKDRNSFIDSISRFGIDFDIEKGSY